ncbi:MAG: two-component regulator propeller domain-containing protein, partial [Bacteroidota bacterium]
MNISRLFKYNTLSLFIAVLAINFSMLSQSAMGEWTLHVPAKKALAVVSHENLVYTAFLSGILEYDTDANEKTLLTSVNSLSDIQISTLGYEPSSGTVVVGYKNGNIDLLTKNRTDNIPFIKLAQLQGVKTINQIVCKNGKIFAATGFGIVVIDPVKKEVKETYYPTQQNESINDISFSGDTIFALTENKLMWAKLNNPALADYNQWTVDMRVPFNSLSNYQDLENINNTLIISKNSDDFGMDSIFTIEASGIVPFSYPTFGLQLNSLTNHNNNLAINTSGGVFVYNNNFDGFIYGVNTFPTGGFINANSSLYRNGEVFIADDYNGSVKVNADVSMEILSFNGPPKNSFYSMDWEDGKLGVAGGGLNEKLYTFNGAGCYSMEDGKWTMYAREEIPIWDTVDLFDCLAVSINPTNIDEMAVSTYSGAPLQIVNGQKEVVGNFTANNSPIESAVLNNGYSLVSDIEYDDDGNLWLLNGYASKTLKVLKANNDWLSFDLGPNSRNNFTTDMVIDYNNNVWLAVEGKGLFAFNYNETLDNPQDDQVQNIVKSDLTENLPSNSIRAIAVDFDNEVWVGTDNGFAIIYNSDNVFESTQPQYLPQRIKLEFEGNVEYLLGSTAINDIEIDGGNRKWLATENSGVFLLSPDGLTIIANYTVENSNLISNNVADLEIDQKT